jgi:hypothetical protein
VGAAAAIAPSACDRESDDIEARRKAVAGALAARGMIVGGFEDVRDHPIARDGGQGVQCARVSHQDADCRLCVILFEDANRAIRAAGRKLMAALPQGSVYLAAGPALYIVEPGRDPAASLVQQVHDELTRLP